MKNLANKLTVFRILLIPVFLLFAYSGHRYIAMTVFILASLSDLADGYVARKYHQISVFGKFMDPLADKMLVLSAMCFFVENGEMPGWTVAVVLLREFAVSGLRLLAVEQKLVIAAGWSGKIKTASTMVCICVILFFNNRVLNLISIVVILTTTMYSGIEYFVRNRQIFKAK